MKKLKIITFLIVGLLGLSIFVIYVASHVPDFQRRMAFIGRMHAKRQLYNDLGLTDEQRKLLKENKNKHRERTKSLFSQIHEKADLIRQQLQKDQLNTEEIYQTNNELKKLQAQMLDDRLESILEVRKILTPEQFKKFIVKMEERTGHFENRWRRPRDGFYGR